MERCWTSTSARWKYRAPSSNMRAKSCRSPDRTVSRRRGGDRHLGDRSQWNAAGLRHPRGGNIARHHRTCAQNRADLQIEQFRVDVAVIGTSAIDPNGTLLDFDIREVEISRAIIEHARKIVLVSRSNSFASTWR